MMMKWTRVVEGKDAEAIVYEYGVAKLGATALAVVALVKHIEVTGDAKWMNHAVKLGRFLLLQQQKDGRFESKYFFDREKEGSFESIYYPGEAVLALTRLQLIAASEDGWAGAAERGVEWLVNVRDAKRQDADLPHDHWLLIAMNELYPLTRNQKHLAHVKRIADSIVKAQRMSSDYPDWIGSYYNPPRSTPTATRAEGLVAMWYLAGKAHLPRDAYLETLKRAAAFQMRCQINSTNNLYLPRPDVALGGFRRALDDWEIRIDYVQHDISSLLGLRRIFAMASPDSK
jgi:hypothetical protein